MADFNGNGGGALSGEDEALLTEFVRPADEVQAVPRPGSVERFWIEDEYAAAETEQIEAYARKAAAEAREAEKLAEALSHEAERAESESEDKHKHATQARKELLQDEEVLGPHVRRPTDAKPLKWVRWALLLGGDVVGIGGAALLLGEEPFNAYTQAMAAGASAVTLGAVGREVRYLMSARIREKDPSELTSAEQPYASWFAGAETASSLIKILTFTCLAGIILIAGGIFALREATEGFTAGLAFGSFALALGLASFYNSFDTADDVAEHIDGKVARVKKVDKAAQEARADKAIAERASRVAEAKLIREENERAGKAAAAGIRRALYAALGNSPGVAGNGPSPTRSEPGGSSGELIEET
jgi:hypothetical protein